MTPEQFVYWLQGYFELAPLNGHPGYPYLTPQQFQCVKEHLKLVFKKRTPTLGETEIPVPRNPTKSKPWEWHPDMTCDKKVGDSYVEEVPFDYLSYKDVQVSC